MTAGNFGTITDRRCRQRSSHRYGRHTRVLLRPRITTATSPTASAYSINNQKQYAGRLQFKIKASDNGEILIKLHALNNDHETAGNYSWAAAHSRCHRSRCVRPAGHAGFRRLREYEHQPVQPGRGSPRDIPTYGVGRQRARQLAIRSGFSFASVTDLHATAEALRRGFGHVAEPDLQLRHRRALPTVLPGISLERHGRGIALDRWRLLHQLQDRQCRADDFAKLHQLSGRRPLSVRGWSRAAQPHDELTVRVRSIGIRPERALDRDCRCPLYER